MIDASSGAIELTAFIRMCEVILSAPGVVCFRSLITCSLSLAVTVLNDKLDVGFWWLLTKSIGQNGVGMFFL